MGKILSARFSAFTLCTLPRTSIPIFTAPNPTVLTPAP